MCPSHQAAAAKWKSLELKGQGQWLLENDEMTTVRRPLSAASTPPDHRSCSLIAHPRSLAQLSFKAAKKYLEAVGEDATAWWAEHTLDEATSAPKPASAPKPPSQPRQQPPQPLPTSLSRAAIAAALAFKFPSVRKAKERWAGWEAFNRADLLGFVPDIGLTTQTTDSVPILRDKLLRTWHASAIAKEKERAQEAAEVRTSSLAISPRPLYATLHFLHSLFSRWTVIGRWSGPVALPCVPVAHRACCPSHIAQ
jgi:hypothetical protein